MLGECRANVTDGGPVFTQHWSARGCRAQTYSIPSLVATLRHWKEPMPDVVGPLAALFVATATIIFHIHNSHKAHHMIKPVTSHRARLKV